MGKRALSLSFSVVAVTLTLLLACAAAIAQTPTYSVIANLGSHKREGYSPRAPLVFDDAGHLFGIADVGGPRRAGSAFELVQQANGSWARRTIADFEPNLTLAVDAAGNLYGTTNDSVFELSPTEAGLWTRTDLYTFNPSSGPYYPRTGVVFDREGNLYGTTELGGLYQGGTLFKLSHQKNGTWAETDLYNFASQTQVNGLTIDQVGNLYGTLEEPGAICSGVVFSLTKPESEMGSWSYIPLHTFPGLNPDGSDPHVDAACPNTVILDTAGNLYGTSEAGGKFGDGTVFEISAGGGENGPDKILYSFNADKSGGSIPRGGVVLDSSGNLYGTVEAGGPYKIGNQAGGGKIFKLLPQKDGSWKAAALYNFGGRTYKGVKGADGFAPLAGLVIGPDDNLYGTTYNGGYYPGEPEGEDNMGYGTVFRLVNH